jgi:hypothetical protein
MRRETWASVGVGAAAAAAAGYWLNPFAGAACGVVAMLGAALVLDSRP